MGAGAVRADECTRDNVRNEKNEVGVCLVKRSGENYDRYGIDIKQDLSATQKEGERERARVCVRVCPRARKCVVNVLLERPDESDKRANIIVNRGGVRVCEEQLRASPVFVCESERANRRVMMVLVVRWPLVMAVLVAVVVVLCAEPNAAESMQRQQQHHQHKEQQAGLADAEAMMYAGINKRGKCERARHEWAGSIKTYKLLYNVWLVFDGQSHASPGS